MLHVIGYRHRLQVKGLPGRPEIVTRKRRKVIFVHGCFWHRHPDPDCRLARLTKTRLDFWLPKLYNNRARDLANVEKLKVMGWKALIVWECELGRREQLSNMLRRFIEDDS